MEEIKNDKNLIAFCGLYCGACGKYLKGKCPGCVKNDKASSCQIRTCCLENKYLSCADCQKTTNIKDCRKFNNFISKIFGLLFSSDRPACIKLIKEKGYDNFAKEMADSKRHAIKK